jgi:hypothetical protein
MFFKISLALVALQTTLALAGNAIIVNRCNYDIWVEPVHNPTAGDLVHVPARSKYQEAFSNAPTSMKISKTNAIVGGKITQFEYVVAFDQVWYDISFVDCAVGTSGANCPGHAEGLSVYAGDGRCGSIECPPNTYCPHQAYFIDMPMEKQGIVAPVFTCPGAGVRLDLTMQVCSSMPALRKRSVAGRLEMEVDDEDTEGIVA